MKDKLKKLTIFIIAICILFMSSSATYGATVENNTTQMYSLTTMEYQGQIIEIPVLTQTTMSKLRNSVFTSEVYVFIPDMTEETMEKNEEYHSSTDDAIHYDLSFPDAFKSIYGL